MLEILRIHQRYPVSFLPIMISPIRSENEARSSMTLRIVKAARPCFKFLQCRNPRMETDARRVSDPPCAACSFVVDRYVAGRNSEISDANREGVQTPCGRPVW
jgi:hypothetical protein